MIKEQVINDFSKKEVEISFRKFSDFANDLMNSERGVFKTNLDIFVDHCENDKVMRIIIALLKRRDIYDKYKDNLVSGRGSMVGCGKLVLPINEYERNTLIYQLLIEIKDNDSLVTSLAIDCDGSSSINSHYHWFNKNILTKLFKSLEYKFEEIMEKVQEELHDNNRIPIQFLLIYNDYSIIVGDDVTIKGDAAIGKEAAIKKT